jgi:hypothetical protein
MGEIKRAYDFLNKTLKLGLKPDQLLVAEAGFKLDLGRQEKFPAALTRDAMRFSADWEVKATLVPRKTVVRTKVNKTYAQLKKDVLGS